MTELPPNLTRGVWCVVCGLWCVVCGVWYVVYGVRCAGCGVRGVWGGIVWWRGMQSNRIQLDFQLNFVTWCCERRHAVWLCGVAWWCGLL